MRDYSSNFFRVIKHPPQIAYALGLGFLMGRVVLLLYTRGRKTGRTYTTPLQYEEINGVYHVTSVKGLQADWVRNLQANPQVRLRVKNRRFPGRAEVTTDLTEIAGFIEYRIKKHPRMIKTIMRLDGLPAEMTREQLEEYAKDLALVKIYPET